MINSSGVAAVVAGRSCLRACSTITVFFFVLFFGSTFLHALHGNLVVVVDVMCTHLIGSIDVYLHVSSPLNTHATRAVEESFTFASFVVVLVTHQCDLSWLTRDPILV